MHCDIPISGTPRVRTDFTRFHNLRNRGDVIQSWWNRAWSQRHVKPEDSFEPFIFAWIAFNGWAECVTGKEKDAEWIKVLSTDATLNRRFRDARNDRTALLDSLDQFTEFWPIPKVQDWRRANRKKESQGHEIRFPGNAPKARAQFFFEQGIKFEPTCWLEHHARAELVPTDWQHCLNALYRVRCNLFHGEKSPQDLVDQSLVGSGFQVLVYFLDGCEEFGPGSVARSLRSPL